MKTHRQILFLFIVSISLYACQWGDPDIGDNLGVGTDAVQQQVIDTFTVQTATVLIDSISTTNATRLLAGQYQDPVLGTVRASSFFQVNLSESFRPDSKAVFDSLTLSLRYDYHYGDTTRLQQLTVHPLSDRLDDTEAYYNTDAAAYEDEVLGNRTFRGRPNTNRRLEIRLSDRLGNRIFQTAQLDGLSDNEEWLDILKGLALVAGRDDDGAVLGFLPDSTQLNLYYHQTGVNEDVQSVFVLKSGFRFNQIKSDRSRTALAALQQVRQSVSSRNTNQESYLQAGVGLGIRIDLPTVQLLRNVRNGGINGAVLTLEPIPQTVSKTLPLPAPLTVYVCDDKNRIVGFLPPSFAGSGQQRVGYATNPGTGQRSYTFDLTQYVTDIVRSPSTRWDGLMILPLEQQNELGRAVIGGNKHPQYAAKLRIYYAVFKM